MLLRLDTYTLSARVVPVLVAFLSPLVLLGTSAVSGVRSGIASSVVLAVLGAVAAQIGRDRGKRLEPELWREWAGSPTLRRLRHRGADDGGGVLRLHRRIEDVLGLALPTAAEEAGDPDAADARYNEATRRLIGLTRDRARFGLLFAENVNYGMRRNLLGLRPIGIAVGVATAIVALLLLLLAPGELTARAYSYGTSIGLALLQLFFFAIVADHDWVRVPAEAYAERLMESVDLLK